MFGKWFTSLLLFRFLEPGCVGALYLPLVCVTICTALLCDVISRSHSMFNANPKLCYMFVRIFAFHLMWRRWHWDALFGCIYGQFQPDLWPLALGYSTKSQGGANNWRALRVTPALFLNLRATTLPVCQGSCKKQPTIFSASPLLFIRFCFHQKKKEPQATFITPFLYYRVVIKEHALITALANMMK